MNVPGEIPVSAVARAKKISHRAAKTLLRGAGILKRIGGRDFVLRSHLRDKLNDTFEEVFELYADMQVETG